MIELYRPTNCPDCAGIEEMLEELVVAHKIITLESDETTPQLTPNTPLPALKDEGKIVSGYEAINAYLIELEQIVADWRRFQGDACYINDSGEIC